MIRRFLNRFRKPEWNVPEGDGRAADDWQRGDLAECICGGPWHGMLHGNADAAGPRRGDILRVADVAMRHGWHSLNFQGDAPGVWFVASNFRRLIQKQREACSAGFAKWLRGKIRPKVDA